MGNVGKILKRKVKILQSMFKTKQIRNENVKWIQRKSKLKIESKTFK